MIYNLVYYVQSLTSLTIKANGIPVGHTGPINVMLQRGGPVAAFHNRNEYAVQVMVKHESEIDAKQTIETIYNAMKNLYNIVLPEQTVKSVVYAAVTVSQLSPKQSPAYIGTDENGLHMYSVNFRVIV